MRDEILRRRQLCDPITKKEKQKKIERARKRSTHIGSSTLIREMDGVRWPEYVLGPQERTSELLDADWVYRMCKEKHTVDQGGRKGRRVAPLNEN